MTLELGLSYTPTLAAHLNRFPPEPNKKYHQLLTYLLQSVQLLHTVNLHKVASIFIRNQTTPPMFSSLSHTSALLSFTIYHTCLLIKIDSDLSYMKDWSK